MSTHSERLMLIRGSASEAEVAALVAVLQAAASAAAASAAPPDARPSSWAAPVRKLRVTHPHGAGGWRASGLPR